MSADPLTPLPISVNLKDFQMGISFFKYVVYIMLYSVYLTRWKEVQLVICMWKARSIHIWLELHQEDQVHQTRVHIGESKLSWQAW